MIVFICLDSDAAATAATTAAAVAAAAAPAVKTGEVFSGKQLKTVTSHDISVFFFFVNPTFSLQRTGVLSLRLKTGPLLPLLKHPTGVALPLIGLNAANVPK